jgi:hypothetical protein
VSPADPPADPPPEFEPPGEPAELPDLPRAVSDEPPDRREGAPAPPPVLDGAAERGAGLFERGAGAADPPAVPLDAPPPVSALTGGSTLGVDGPPTAGSASPGAAPDGAGVERGSVERGGVGAADPDPSGMFVFTQMTSFGPALATASFRPDSSRTSLVQLICAVARPEPPARPAPPTAGATGPPEPAAAEPSAGAPATGAVPASPEDHPSDGAPPESPWAPAPPDPSWAAIGLRSASSPPVPTEPGRDGPANRVSAAKKIAAAASTAPTTTAR